MFTTETILHIRFEMTLPDPRRPVVIAPFVVDKYADADVGSGPGTACGVLPVLVGFRMPRASIGSRLIVVVVSHSMRISTYL